jgi:hypothetical protein
MADPVNPRGATDDPRTEVVVPGAERAVPAVTDDDLEHETLLAILGGAKRTGEWTPPELLHTIAIMGGVELDFRGAVLAPGLTEVRIFALMGGVTITIPRDVDVEVTATAVMGGVDQKSAQPGEGGDDRGPRPSPAAPGERRPLIVISGIAIMGGIDVRLV